jgi:hypothetical protein
MQKEPKTPYYKQINEKEKLPTISEILQLIYSSSLLIGIMLSFFYYYHIGFWPSLSSASAVSYLIGIFSVGFLISLLIFILFSAPSFVFFLDIKKSNVKEAFPYLMVFAWLIWLIILLFMSSTLPLTIIASGITFLMLSVLFIEKKSIPVSYLFDNLLIVFTLISLLSLALMLPFIAFNNEILNYYYLLCIFLCTATLSIYINHRLIKQFNSAISMKSQIINSLYILIFLSLGFSIIPMITDSKNPLIFKPFQQLHFGDYNATLQFTHDFNSSLLYPYNGKVFKILSSVGDEYIIKISDNNSTYRVNKKYILQESIIDKIQLK